MVKEIYVFNEAGCMRDQIGSKLEYKKRLSNNTSNFVKQALITSMSYMEIIYHLLHKDSLPQNYKAVTTFGKECKVRNLWSAARIHSHPFSLCVNCQILQKSTWILITLFSLGESMREWILEFSQNF